MVKMRLYDSLVRKLYQVNMFNAAKLGLSNIRRLHEVLGNPADGLPGVHIAGTNGKGSVALKIARSLERGGKKTGLFVSPHVSCFRERMQVNGELIPEERVEHMLPKIFEVCDSREIPATFFEITTALAFQHFADSAVDVIVVEAGLGGRLDSTNIITPSVSIVTSIGLDHTRVLGDTIEQIAAEKAGIFKAGVPALVGEKCPLELLQGIASDRGSPFFRVKDLLANKEEADKLAGALAPSAPDFDEENSLLAEAGLRLLWQSHPELRVDEAAVRQGLAMRPPCRFEVREVEVGVDAPQAVAAPRGVPGGGEKKTGVTVVLDAAHNPPAIASFFHKLAKEFRGRRFRVVAAFSRDKESKVCLSSVLKIAGPDRIHLAEASTPRATPAVQLASTLAEISGGKFDASRRVRTGSQSVREAVRDALNEAALSGAEGSEKDMVVICGTVFMMVDAREEIGIIEPQDSAVIAEVAGAHLRNAQDNMGLS